MKFFGVKLTGVDNSQYMIGSYPSPTTGQTCILLSPIDRETGVAKRTMAFDSSAEAFTFVDEMAKNPAAAKIFGGDLFKVEVIEIKNVKEMN